MKKIDIHRYSKVGKITKDLSNKINFGYTGEIYASPGVIKHIKKRHKNGKNALSYKIINNILPTIEDIILAPDYIGTHPCKVGTSIEFVKKVDVNLLVAVEVDLDNNYIYVASLYPLSESKLNSRITSGRLIKYEQLLKLDKLPILD